MKNGTKAGIAVAAMLVAGGFVARECSSESDQNYTFKSLNNEISKPLPLKECENLRTKYVDASIHVDLAHRGENPDDLRGVELAKRSNDKPVRLIDGETTKIYERAFSKCNLTR